MTWQAEAIKASDMTLGDIAQRMRCAFPKTSKAALSLAQRPAETGISFTAAANRALAAVLGVARPRRDRRRCPIRVQARLTEADARALNAARKTMGHKTINDALVCAIRWYIAEAKKRAAVDVAASHDGKANYYTSSIRAGG